MERLKGNEVWIVVRTRSIAIIQVRTLPTARLLRDLNP